MRLIPPWVMRQLDSQEGGSSMDVFGYFASDEIAFRKLFGEYEMMAKETCKRFQL